MVWLRGLEQQVGETFLLTALGKISVERGAKNNYSDFRWNLLEINEPELRHLEIKLYLIPSLFSRER